MEILMKNEEPSEYYDEVLYVASNYRKFVKNPRRKITGLKRYALFLTSISLIFLVIFSILTIIQKKEYIYIVILFLAAFVLGIVYYLLIRNRISKFKSRDISKKLIIEKDNVEFVLGDDVYKLAKSEIQYILINRYSICFLPRTKTHVLSAYIKYKNQILANISDKSIIVDNRDLY